MQFHGIRKWDQERFPGFDLVAYHDHCTDGIMAAAVASWVSTLRQKVERQYFASLPPLSAVAELAKRFAVKKEDL